MRSCPLCGGIIGRDCFNPVECAWITQSMNEQYAVDDYIRSEQDKAEREHHDALEREHNDYLESEHRDFIVSVIADENVMIGKFLKSQ